MLNDLCDKSLYMDNQALYCYLIGYAGEEFFLNVRRSQDGIYFDKDSTLSFGAYKTDTLIQEFVYRIEGDSAFALVQLSEVKDYYSLLSGTYFFSYPRIAYSQKISVKSLFTEK